MKVLAKARILHDGVRYEPGDELTVSQVEGEALVAAGAAEEKVTRRRSTKSEDE